MLIMLQLISKRQDAVLKHIAEEFETAYLAYGLAANIDDILDAKSGCCDKATVKFM